MKKKTNNTAKILGKQIKIQRIKREIAQEKLAIMANIHRNTLSKIERGIVLPKVITLIKIANALNININDLIYY